MYRKFYFCYVFLDKKEKSEVVKVLKIGGVRENGIQIRTKYSGTTYDYVLLDVCTTRDQGELGGCPISKFRTQLGGKILAQILKPKGTT